jgi:23S rRNA pseudouridine2605 synthase
MSKKPFEKFINKTATGAKKKEALRQEKRKAKAEARAIGEQFRKKETDRRQTHNYQVTLNAKLNIDKKVEEALKAKPERENSNTEIPNSKVPPRSSRSANQTSDIKKSAIKKTGTDENEPMPLNKFIAHAGVCGRREAAELVKQGKVTVNGDKVYEPGLKVTAKDKIEVKGKLLFLQKNLVYILLNKPKDFLTTSKDPQGRKTVLDLVKAATPERVYPVGRLDRNTTGVLILTNDGELAQKLTHPSFEVKKIYEAKLDKPLVKKDYDAIIKGLELEDGIIKADGLAYADAKDKSIIGIEIHSGKNRIVRRIFEHLGYEVKNLDRVFFANLTKKNVDRGKWRFLSEKEIRLLKFMNQSFVRKKAEPNDE